MVYVKIRHIKRVRGRKGETYFYHQITKEKLGRDPLAAAKKAQKINLTLEDRKAETSGIGTIKDLVDLYQAASDFTNLAAKTKKDYKRYLDFLAEKFGDAPAKDMDREFVLTLRQKFSDTPRKADYMIAVLRRLCAFAIDRPKRFELTINPALRSGRLAKPDGHKPWPPALIAGFREHAAKELLWVVEFILNTGQRSGDAVKATWTDIEAGGLHVAQNKTGAEIWVPFTDDFALLLEAIPRKGNTILAPTYADKWHLDTLRHEVQAQVERLGFKAYSLHGLRYNAAVNLAAAGCSTHQIAAVTGHKTLAMVEKYTAKGDQRKLAQAAITKLQSGQKSA